MARVKRGFKARQRRKGFLKLAKGYLGRHKSSYIVAREQVEHGLVYQFRDRRARKRDFRTLWISRINAAVREHGLSYSKFIAGLLKANVALDRKSLAEIALHDPVAFTHIIEVVKKAA